MKLVDAVKKKEKAKKDAVYTRPEPDARMKQAMDRMKSVIRMPQLEKDIREHNERMEKKKKKGEE